MRPFAPEPLAYFLTWTTFGTWLPGDSRGWANRGVCRGPNPRLRRMAARLTHDRPVGFGQVERELVEQVIAGHCQVRGWMLHAVHCRAEHVHVVVSARDREPGVVIGEFKAWCTRALRAAGRIADVGATWGHGGSCRRLYDAFAVERVVMYVRECQDGPRHARGGGRRNALPW